ncbi:MAG TPA: hypothetical protein VID75_13015, partial [Acidimicrobiales bacterium]
LPVTATSKVITRALRAERWNCTDPVWWRPDRPPDAPYRLLDRAHRTDLDKAVAGRSDVAAPRQ